MTDLDKFVKLDEFIKRPSEAFDLISGYDRGLAGNYHSAWADLCRHYDDARKQVSGLVERVMQLPRTVMEYQSLMQMFNTVNHLVRSMTQYEMDATSWAPVLVPIMESKSDDEVMAAWKDVLPAREIAKLDPMLKFLADKAERCLSRGTRSRHQRQNNSSNASSRGNQSRNSSATRSIASTSSTQSKPRTKPPVSCMQCKLEHQLFSCPQFRAMEIPERWRKVRIFRVCENCLKPGCRADKCSLRPCRVCNVKHNELLCDKATQPTVNAAQGDKKQA